MSRLITRCLMGAVVSAVCLTTASITRASEADLVLPDGLTTTPIFGTTTGVLLMVGLGVCLLGGAFGLLMCAQLKNLPVHRSMREISELIYETCKTYLVTQGKFILVLEVFIGAIMVAYFG